MSDEEPRSGISAGWIVGGVIAAVLGLMVLGLVAVGFIFYLGVRQVAVTPMMPPPPAWSSASPTPPYAGVSPIPPPPADDGAAAAPAEPDFCRVAVKLAGVTPKGVKYVIDAGDADEDAEGPDECVGEEALVKALKELAAGDTQDPADDARLVVDLDVATASGVTQAQVDAAVKACWAAGAAVLPPPDLEKEKRPLPPVPTAKPEPLKEKTP